MHQIQWLDGKGSERRDDFSARRSRWFAASLQRQNHSCGAQFGPGPFSSQGKYSFFFIWNVLPDVIILSWYIGQWWTQQLCFRIAWGRRTRKDSRNYVKTTWANASNAKVFIHFQWFHLWVQYSAILHWSTIDLFQSVAMTVRKMPRHAWSSCWRKSIKWPHWF